MEQYPAVRFLTRHGDRAAILVGLAPPILALAGLAAADWHWIWLLIAIVAGGFLGFMFRAFVELTRIIAEMLLPQ